MLDVCSKKAKTVLKDSALMLLHGIHFPNTFTIIQRLRHVSKIASTSGIYFYSDSANQNFP
ncbi:hypothetical protein T4B_3277 [Trichinella pseudospiralis]|uniref:Uncharacterized protein n=1 Tax=Trichinella pseudospiralis TaxID=6337 RepID=A0A0V1J5W9_TRIPS|nr:hypothetical protein T4B_3277 [Trichinella pseudospiralis]